MGAIPKHITDRLKQIVSQVSGKIEDPEKELIAEYRIKGSGIMYCLMSDNRNFCKITRGARIYIIQENYDINNRTLIYTHYGDIVLIEPDEIEKIGYD
tara:strand:- start:3699 stop:3992 length:294 start_codon:yes stop_codon:yes gene_type:complete